MNARGIPDRGVSSTPAVVLYWGWGTLPGGTPARSPPLPARWRPPPHPGPGWGTLPAGPGWGTPLARWGTPPSWTWPGTPGTPPARWGTPLWTDRRTDTCQNITFPRTTYAVGNERAVGCCGYLDASSRFVVLDYSLMLQYKTQFFVLFHISHSVFICCNFCFFYRKLHSVHFCYIYSICTLGFPTVFSKTIEKKTQFR